MKIELDLSEEQLYILSYCVDNTLERWKENHEEEKDIPINGSGLEKELYFCEEEWIKEMEEISKQLDTFNP